MPEMMHEVEEEMIESPIVEIEKETSARKQIREEEEQTLLDYLRSLQADKPIRVTVVRKRPKLYKGQTTEGTLDTFEEPVSEEDIREAYGGGVYALRITVPNAKGNWVYAAQRMLKIAGDPKIDGIKSGNEESPSVVNAALKMTERMMMSAEDRARKAETEVRRPNNDGTLDFLRSEMSDLRRMVGEKDRQIYELLNRKPESTQEQMLLGKMIDGESARIVAIRTQVESEIRTLQERHTADIDRLHSRFDDMTRRADDAHRRETDTMRASYDNQMATLKISYDGQIQGFIREIQHLDRELTAAKTELAELRVRKDKSPVETLTEMAAMKEALDSFSGASGGEEKGSTIERILSAAGPLVEGVATRIAQGPPGAVAAPAPVTASAMPDLPVGQPMHLPDGRIIIKRPDGEIVEIRRKRKPQPQPVAEGEMPPLDPGEVAMAIQFMEQALQNDTDPTIFAQTARNVVPDNVLAYLRIKGVDYFLSDVAKLESNPASPLHTQHGKNWVRKVASVLLGE